ncbi:hypothetical protein GA0070613_1271 [Micromonospora inositola]|uniref:Uncharacterized protein n=1 Tax=Micromonospora inositola TaxID=47865 RepID=A0A1C5HFL5_9ACTN|nr:hypothetical protein GA0070613_1271 [Micromonospora inositola]
MFLVPRDRMANHPGRAAEATPAGMGAARPRRRRCMMTVS